MYGSPYRFFNNGLHSAVAYSDFFTYLIYCYSLVTFTDVVNFINFFKHYAGFGPMQISQILHKISAARRGLMLCTCVSDNVSLPNCESNFCKILLGVTFSFVKNLIIIHAVGCLLYTSRCV